MLQTIKSGTIMKKIIYYEAYSACLLYKCFAIVVAMVVVMLSLFFFFCSVLKATIICWLECPLVLSTAFHPPASLWGTGKVEQHKVGVAWGPRVVQDQFCLHHWSKHMVWYESPEGVWSSKYVSWEHWTRSAVQWQWSGKILRSWSWRKVIRSQGCHLDTGPVEWAQFSWVDC